MTDIEHMLCEIRRIDRQITRSKARAQACYEAAAGATSRISAERFGGTGMASKVERGVCDAMELEELIAELQAQRSKIWQMTLPYTDALTYPLQKQVFMMRYRDAKTIGRIADVLGYSERHIKRVHRLAIMSLACHPTSGVN